MDCRNVLSEISRYRNAYILALSASMGSIFYGWDTGLMGGILTLKSFQNYFGINEMSASAQANFNGNIVSIMQAGCLYVVVQNIQYSISPECMKKHPASVSCALVGYLVASDENDP